MIFADDNKPNENPDVLSVDIWDHTLDANVAMIIYLVSYVNMPPVMHYSH